jgi:hypothetical protein
VGRRGTHWLGVGLLALARACVMFPFATSQPDRRKPCASATPARAHAAAARSLAPVGAACACCSALALVASLRAFQPRWLGPAPPPHAPPAPARLGTDAPMHSGPGGSQPIQ